MLPTLKQWSQKANAILMGLVTQPASADGRLLLILILGVYFFQLAAYSRIGDPQYLWTRYGVPVMPHSYSDLRDILSGFDCTRLGYNVLVSDPCDLVRSNLNYPLVWMMLTPLGLRQVDADWVGPVLGLLFFVAVLLAARPLNVLEATVYGVILVSPSLMLGVERGNMDLLMYVLFCGAFLILNNFSTSYARLTAYGLILIAAFFKLYPVFAFAVILREKTKTALVALAGFGLTFGLYYWSRLAEFKAVYSDYPKNYVYSFGRMVVPQIFSELAGSASVTATLEWLSIMVMGLVILGALFLARRSRLAVEPLRESWQLDQFRVGAALYIGCFALGYNYDYRLVFLVFTMPLMFYWLKNASSFLKGLAGLSLVSLIITVWLSRWSTFVPLFSWPDKLFFLDEFLNWFLLFFCCYGFFITLPEWLRPFFTPQLLKVQPTVNSDRALSTF